MCKVLPVCPQPQATLPAPQEDQGKYQSPPPSRPQPLPALLDPVVIPLTVLVLILIQEVLGVPQQRLLNLQGRTVKVRKLGLILDNLSGLTEDHLRACQTHLSGLKPPHVLHHILLDSDPLLPLVLPEQAQQLPLFLYLRDLQQNDFYPFEIVIVKLPCLPQLIYLGS